MPVASSKETNFLGSPSCIFTVLPGTNHPIRVAYSSRGLEKESRVSDIHQATWSSFTREAIFIKDVTTNTAAKPRRTTEIGRVKKMLKSPLDISSD